MNVDAINELYKKSCDLIVPYIRLEGNPKDAVKNDPATAWQALREGIKGLEEVVAFNNQNWAALWMIGKAYQALDENEKSYESFLAAHRVALTEGNILRELALQCLKTKRYDNAAYYCAGAQEFDPNDYTLWANMAVAKMFLNKLDEATDWANRCLAKLPEDGPSLTVLRLIKEIKEGTRQLPEDFDVLENEP